MCMHTYLVFPALGLATDAWGGGLCVVVWKVVIVWLAFPLQFWGQRPSPAAGERGDWGDWSHCHRWVRWVMGVHRASGYCCVLYVRTYCCVMYVRTYDLWNTWKLIFRHQSGKLKWNLRISLYLYWEVNRKLHFNKWCVLKCSTNICTCHNSVQYFFHFLQGLPWQPHLSHEHKQLQVGRGQEVVWRAHPAGMELPGCYL